MVAKISKKNDPKKIKERIIERFFKDVRGNKEDTSGSNKGHDGKGGHWLESQMGIKHNSSNTPDIDGFEMKNHTTSKTTFGDWSPNLAIYKGRNRVMTRDLFLQVFGTPNPEKNNRYSWSGKPCPKIDTYNSCGQILIVDKIGNIFAIYSFRKDQRANKSKVVPRDMQKDELILAEWSAERMKIKVERKFNKSGWFKCIKNKDGIYVNIVFGNPINFQTWIDGVRKGLIFFDSGMYQGNPRPYAQWRASNKYWDLLVTEKY
jgi:hypothetical protein